MNDSQAAYLLVFLMFVVTLATRFGGAAIMSRVRLTPATEAFLRSLSSSVLVAMIATTMVQGGLRATVSVVVAGIVMTLTRSAVLAMIAGVASAALWTLLGP